MMDLHWSCCGYQEIADLHWPEGQAVTSQERERKCLEGKWKQSQIIPSTLHLTLPPNSDCFLFSAEFSNKRT